MGRQKKQIRYWKKGRFIYYKTEDMETFKSTGETTKAMAERVVAKLIQSGTAGKVSKKLGDYAEPYFVWGSCPHATRLLAEGGHITERYCIQQRRWLVKYVLPSKLASKAITEIKRGDLVDFRTQLQHKGLSANNINSVMKALKVVLSEACFRQDITSNPATGMGVLRTHNKEAGIFSKAELVRLFKDPANSLLWQTQADYICFLIASLTGMRCSEILALKWGNVHLNDKYIHICEAWKNQSHTQLGLPKSYKTRDVLIHQFLLEQLTAYKNLTIYSQPDDFVVCRDDGTPYPVWTWNAVFKRALNGIGIKDSEIKQRHLKPHSFRHTINTILREHGIDPYVIRLMLGWGDDRIQRNYTHIDITRMIKEGNITDAVFADYKLLED